MAVNLSPVGGVAAQFFTNSGAVLTGGKIFTYLAGTTTPATAYTSSNGATAWTNPIVLDAAGRVSGSGEIWITDGLLYKFLLKDANDVLIATYDNISGINSNFIAFVNQQQIVTATAGQTVFNLGISYQPGTNSLSVFVDGVNQYGPGALYAYAETDSDTVTFTSGLHVGAEVKFTTSQLQGAGAVDAQQVSYTPPFTGSVATNVEAKLAQTVSVKDFGAVGDGVTDDTAAIQAAINTIDGCVFIPEGTYKITSALTLPARVSMAGAGRMSILAPDACDGIVFSAGNTNGARSFRDFAIIGTGTDASTAITSDLDSTPPSLTRNTGVVFDNLYIDGFGTGVYGRGFWNVMFSNIYMLNIYNGFTFVGQSVKLTLLNCSVVCNGFSGTGNPITGITTSFGLYAGQGTYAVRPENLSVESCYLYGFDVGIHWRSVLFGSIVATDLDFCQQEGVRVTSADGGFILRDCWIDMNNASYDVIGVNFVNLGSAASPAARAVLNNRIGSENHDVNAKGVYLGANHTGVDVSGNVINGFGEGIRADAATNPRFTKNYITENTVPSGGNVNLLNLTDMVFSDNYVEISYAGLNTCTNSYFGKNYGAYSTFAIGQITIPGSATSATVTLASLGINDFPASGTVRVLFNNPATNNRNSVWGNCDGTNLTCYVETAFGAPAGINFQILMT